MLEKTDTLMAGNNTLFSNIYNYRRQLILQQHVTGSKIEWFYVVAIPPTNGFLFKVFFGHDQGIR